MENRREERASQESPHKAKLSIIKEKKSHQRVGPVRLGGGKKKNFVGYKREVGSVSNIPLVTGPWTLRNGGETDAEGGQRNWQEEEFTIRARQIKGRQFVEKTKRGEGGGGKTRESQQPEVRKEKESGGTTGKLDTSDYP